MPRRLDRNLRRTRLTISTLQPSRVLVIGGSIGGLTAACLLRDAGHDVEIHERAPRELEQRGAGIGFLRACSRYLAERAGVDMDEISITTSEIVYLDRDDTVLHQADHAYRFSSWNTVYRRLLGAFDGDRYHLDRTAVEVRNDERGASVAFDDGSALSADLVVAADGIGSTVRAQLLPDARADYSGYVAWRGTVSEADLPAEITARLGDAITYHVYANSHILVYPIPSLDGSVEPGERLLNFVWYRNYLDGGDLRSLLTDHDGVVRDLSVPPGLVAPEHVAELRATAAARLPATIAAVVAAVEEPFLQVVYDISISRMRFGRVCLIGDAAFAVRPHAAAGTAKAAEDAWTLDRHLRSGRAIDSALQRWETEQLALGRDLLDRTRRIGARSQMLSTWKPGDPELIFGLHAPGDPEPANV